MTASIGKWPVKLGYSLRDELDVVDQTQKSFPGSDVGVLVSHGLGSEPARLQQILQASRNKEEEPDDRTEVTKPKPVCLFAYLGQLRNDQGSSVFKL